MLGQPRCNESDDVSVIRRPIGFCRLRNWRGLLAVLVAITYLASGALHGLHYLDVANPTGKTEIASMLGDGSAGHGDHKALTGHHCHGCFSVAVAQPVQAAAVLELVAAPEPAGLPAIVGVIPDLESPPPKT
jgi:hypothetical protein